MRCLYVFVVILLFVHVFAGPILSNVPQKVDRVCLPVRSPLVSAIQRFRMSVMFAGLLFGGNKTIHLRSPDQRIIFCFD